MDMTDQDRADVAFRLAIAAGRLACGCGCQGAKTDRRNPLDAGSWMYMGDARNGDALFKHCLTRRYLHQYEHDAAARGVWVADEIARDVALLGWAQ